MGYIRSTDGLKVRTVAGRHTRTLHAHASTHVVRIQIVSLITVSGRQTYYGRLEAAHCGEQVGELAEEEEVMHRAVQQAINAQLQGENGRGKGGGS